ncbi:MAG: TetR/AcrR family transcriptional regulator [Psychromonas sp.]|nr:TetR/AcrR family transcriptional regulator [Psychromonas sp.]
MPYTKQHKHNSKQRILKSAFQLFTANGFDGVTINKIMENCSLTRGAFYAHFSSKSMLYSEVVKYAATSSKLAELKSEGITDKQWLTQLLDAYLSIEHVNGERACPLAFLATDIVTQDVDARAAYCNAYMGMNKIILDYVNKFSSCNQQQVLAVTSMIIGAVAISRTIENSDEILLLLTSCREEVGKLLGGI